MNRRISVVSFVVIALMMFSFSFAEAAGKMKPTPEDQKTTKSVYNALEKEFQLNLMEDTDFTVKTYNGVVTLTGTVKELATKEKATEVARKVPGVKSVQNRMTIKADN